jgi:hypothetical protein
MIASKEPNHSLGGYSYQEHSSRTRRKEKKTILYAGHDNERETRSKYFLVYTRKNLTIALGATPIGSAERAPNENGVIRIMKHALEQVINYLIKR